MMLEALCQVSLSIASCLADLVFFHEYYKGDNCTVSVPAIKLAGQV